MDGEEQESPLERGGSDERRCSRVDPRVSRGQQDRDPVAPPRFGVGLLDPRTDLRSGAISQENRPEPFAGLVSCSKPLNLIASNKC